MVRSLNRDIDFFEIITRILQADKFEQYIFIIYLDYILRTSKNRIKENGFT